MAKYWPIAFVFLFCSVLAFAAYQIKRPPNYVLMHDVHVLQRLDKQTFRAEVVNPATGEWYSFLVKSCPEFEPTHEIERGVTFTMLQYVEDRTRSCMELDGKYAGYILKRDANGNAVISTNAGSPTTPNQASASSPATAGAD